MQHSFLKRLFLVVLLFVAAFIAPANVFSLPNTTLAIFALIGVTICVAPLIAAYSRRADLHAAVARELMKMRRIYHLAKHLGAADDGHRPWFTELHGNIVGYLSFFSSKEFKGYSSSDAAFRKVSYHIYGAPELGNKKDEALYAELLDTVADVAYTRQHIKELLMSGMSTSERGAIFLITSLSTLVVLVGGAGSETDRIVAGALAVSVFLASEVLARVDGASELLWTMPQRYAENVAKLELRHRDEE